MVVFECRLEPSVKYEKDYSTAPSYSSGTQNGTWYLLIPPTLQIRAGRCAFHDSVDDLGGVELVVTQPRDCIRAGVVAVPAVFGAAFVVDFAAIERVLCCLEKIVNQVHCVIQKIVVSLADIDVDLAFEFRTDQEQDLNAEYAEVFAKVAEEYSFGVFIILQTDHPMAPQLCGEIPERVTTETQRGGTANLAR